MHPALQEHQQDKTIDYDNHRYKKQERDTTDGENNRSALKFEMGWMMGIEPTTTGATIRGSTTELHPP